MTITFSIGDIPPVDLLAETHQLYTQTAEELVLAVNAIKAGQFEEVRSAQASVRDLKAAFFLVMDERAKLDKLRKQVAGTVGPGQLDLHAARDEIGRRLARLRDANGG